jgi:hypothetical protein
MSRTARLPPQLLYVIEDPQARERRLGEPAAIMFEQTGPDAPQQPRPQAAPIERIAWMRHA